MSRKFRPIERLLLLDVLLDWRTRPVFLLKTVLFFTPPLSRGALTVVKQTPILSFIVPRSLQPGTRQCSFLLL